MYNTESCPFFGCALDFASHQVWIVQHEQGCSSGEVPRFFWKTWKSRHERRQFAYHYVKMHETKPNIEMDICLEGFPPDKF